jgi:membrane-bound lytic murein transglycosylase D
MPNLRRGLAVVALAAAAADFCYCANETASPVGDFSAGAGGSASTGAAGGDMTGGADREMPPGAFQRCRPPVLDANLGQAIASLSLDLSPAGALDQTPSATPAASTPTQGPSAPQAPAGETFSIPIPWGEPSFESFRAAYLSPDGRKWLEAIMARAGPYLPWIAERVRFYGLPDELVFLPVIESEFSPAAVSRSGATGLWQFMKNSIGGYGIRIDDWVDERRDFIKSTDAALRKLADNYASYGDWNLALAAYNMGDGAVARAVRRARSEAGAPASIDYWYLRRKGCLAAETTSYVPKFLAVAAILSYPRRNGIKVSWDEPQAWASLELSRSIDLCLLADAAKLPLAALKTGNAELRYTVTPPYAGYRIKVPAAAEQAVRAALDDPGLKLLRYYLHTVRSGDTLSAVSRHYGTPLNMIVQANPGLRPDLLRLGQVIVVPALKEAAPMPVATPVDDNLDFSGSYAVIKGDTLWSISLRYNVQPEVLAAKNGLTLQSVLHEGMPLRVPILK